MNETVIFFFIAFASQHHLQRSKQGIVEQCCSRPCSYSYLKTFCDEEELTTTTTTEAYANEVSPRQRLTCDIVEIYFFDQLQIDDVDLVETLKRKLGKEPSQSHNGPVKTFRSLFHLLTYISQIWTEKEQFKNGTSVQTPSTK